MKRCPECDKFIWPGQIVVHTSKSDKNKVYHDECYWKKKLRGGNDSSFKK